MLALSILTLVVFAAEGTRIWQMTSESELNSDTLVGADADAVIVGRVDAALLYTAPDLRCTGAAIEA